VLVEELVESGAFGVARTVDPGSREMRPGSALVLDGAESPEFWIRIVHHDVRSGRLPLLKRGP
jgi:hypothetical protein